MTRAEGVSDQMVCYFAMAMVHNTTMVVRRCRSGRETGDTTTMPTAAGHRWLPLTNSTKLLPFVVSTMIS